MEGNIPGIPCMFLRHIPALDVLCLCPPPCAPVPTSNEKLVGTCTPVPYVELEPILVLTLIGGRSGWIWTEPDRRV